MTPTKERPRATFSRYTEGDKTYYSFTPSAVQFWLTLCITLGTFLLGMRYIVFLDLRPTVKNWVAEDFHDTITEHETFAKKSEVINLIRAIDIDRDAQAQRTIEWRAELTYLRARVDAIADKVGARK